MSERTEFNPTLNVSTDLGDVDLTYDNTVLVRYEDEADNYAIYHDGASWQRINLLKYDWENLLYHGYPWDHVPDPPKDWEWYQCAEYKLKYDRSRLCTFRDPKYNHIEHKENKNVLGIKIDSDTKKFAFDSLVHLFRPYPDENTIKWYESYGT